MRSLKIVNVFKRQNNGGFVRTSGDTVYEVTGLKNRQHEVMEGK